MSTITGAMVSSAPSRMARKKQLWRPVWQATPAWSTSTSSVVPTTYLPAAIDQAVAAIQFDAQGLVPAIAQQHDSGEILMMAWMDRDAVAETMRTGRVCYWSRSRKAPWRKGDTSGHIQELVELRIDCDGDTLLAEVEQTGVACHTGRHSCFFRAIRNGELEEIAPVDIDMATLGKAKE